MKSEIYTYLNHILNNAHCYLKIDIFNDLVFVNIKSKILDNNKSFRDLIGKEFVCSQGWYEDVGHKYCYNFHISLYEVNILIRNYYLNELI